AHCRENPYALISRRLPETEPEGQVRHEVRRQLDLVASVGAINEHPVMRFQTRAMDRESLKSKLARLGMTGDHYMVAHCGATAPSRRYPAEYFAQAFRMIGSRAGAIVLTGDNSERALIADIV